MAALGEDKPLQLRPSQAPRVHDLQGNMLARRVFSLQSRTALSFAGRICDSLLREIACISVDRACMTLASCCGLRIFADGLLPRI